MLHQARLPTQQENNQYFDTYKLQLKLRSRCHISRKLEDDNPNLVLDWMSFLCSAVKPDLYT